MCVVNKTGEFKYTEHTQKTDYANSDQEVTGGENDREVKWNDG